MAASFFGALNALGIGVLGEYVLRIYDQVRGRPPFIVARRTNFHENGRTAPAAVLGWLDAEWNAPVAEHDVVAAASSRES